MLEGAEVISIPGINNFVQVPKSQGRAAGRTWPARPLPLSLRCLIPSGAEHGTCSPTNTPDQRQARDPSQEDICEENSSHPHPNRSSLHPAPSQNPAALGPVSKARGADFKGIQESWCGWAPTGL